MAYDRSNSGVLFRNDRKQKQNDPDYTGSWTDEHGQEYWLSAWVKESKSGQKYFSLARGNAKQQRQAPQQQAPEQSFQDDQDIPF